PQQLRTPRVRIWQAGQVDLGPDQFCPVRPSLLLQPPGVIQAWLILFGVCADGAQECSLFIRDHGASLLLLVDDPRGDRRLILPQILQTKCSSCVTILRCGPGPPRAPVTPAGTRPASPIRQGSGGVQATSRSTPRPSRLRVLRQTDPGGRCA